jgi:LysR family transcriptional activator of nhaA
MSRAADRLNMAVQTISAQVRELERDLGFALLKPSGRGLVLTEAGKAAMLQAEQIFQLGEQLATKVQQAVHTGGIRLAVGISDGLPKLAVHRLLDPILQTPNLSLVCHEGELDDLLGDLALHRLDVLLADRPAPSNPNLKLYSHLLDSSDMMWFASASLFAAARLDFPRSMAHVPILLPTAHGSLRLRIDAWFERHGIVPKVVGEFEDSALLATFGAAGMGVFPAAELIYQKLTTRYEVQKVGSCEGVSEQFFAISTEKRVAHPLVLKLLLQARNQ